MTKQPSTQDTYEARLREARAAVAEVQQQAIQQRIRYAAHHDTIMKTVDHWQAIGDDLYDLDTDLPDVPFSEDLRPRMIPVLQESADAAIQSICDTIEHAYKIAGHYRRLAGRMVQFLDDVPSDPAVDVLDLDVAEQLGYLAPSDEWVNGEAEPLNEWLQNAADLMQRAGLLPAFDSCFPVAEPTEEPTSV